MLQSLLYHTYKYQPCFHGISLHLTETSQLTDDISLCSYLVEYTYLSAFYKIIIILIIKKTVIIMVIVFECVVCCYVACSPWHHHRELCLICKGRNIQRLNKCRQPTHALHSTQVNSECPTVQVCKERQLQTCMH